MTFPLLQHSSTGLVAFAYIPSYLGGGDWEDCGSRPALAKK
jgi:hypothetical protein